MPIYTYRCAACGYQFEQIQRFADDPLTECPTCAGGVRRVIQPVGVVFKGSGWYITDSRKPPAEAKAKTKEPAAAGKEKTEGGDGGDKSAAPAEKKAAADAKPAAD